MSGFSLRSSIWSVVKEQIQTGTLRNLFLARFSDRIAGAKMTFGFMYESWLYDTSREVRLGDHSDDLGSSCNLLLERFSSSKLGSCNKHGGIDERLLFCKLIFTTCTTRRMHVKALISTIAYFFASQKFCHLCITDSFSPMWQLKVALSTCVSIIITGQNIHRIKNSPRARWRNFNRENFLQGKIFS